VKTGIAKNSWKKTLKTSEFNKADIWSAILEKNPEF
jgi:hypothetical protein